MKKQFDTLVYIGRFRPIHNAHVEIIKRACEMAKQLVIIIGSAKQPRTYKNPWTSQERETMIRAAVEDIDTRGCNVVVDDNYDTIYNNQAWAVRVQGIVGKYRIVGPKVGIIGHDKDETTFYLSMFPQWERVEVPLIEPLNATDIRDIYFRQDTNIKYIQHVLPKATALFLKAFMETEAYQQVIRERLFVETYKKKYAGLDHPPIFVTVDGIVIQSGHVLMIKRKSEPGRGLWALPGGFMNAYTDPSIQEAMIRELREETGLKVPGPVLTGSIVKSRVFDAIERSARGRTITHAFHIQLPDGPLPRVKGMDDAKKAKWTPIAELKREELFEDHADIIEWALGG